MLPLLLPVGAALDLAGIAVGTPCGRSRGDYTVLATVADDSLPTLKTDGYRSYADTHGETTNPTVTSDGSLTDSAPPAPVSPSPFGSTPRSLPSIPNSTTCRGSRPTRQTRAATPPSPIPFARSPSTKGFTSSSPRPALGVAPDRPAGVAEHRQRLAGTSPLTVPAREKSNVDQS